MASFKVTLKARLLLYDRGRILLLRQTKPNGGNYTLPGGTIEREEFAKACLIRESKEEAAITLQAQDLSLVHVLHKRTRKEHRVVLYFKAYRYEGRLKALETEKFKKVEWFELDNLPRNLTATVRHVLKAYRRGQLYSEMSK